MESVYGLHQSRMRVSMGGGTGRSLISLMSRCISSAFTMRPRVMEAISSMSAVLTGLPIFSSVSLMVMMGSVTDTAGTISAFDRMEAKADAMLDKANAMAELNASGKDETDDLMSKYDAEPSSAVSDELAALKAKMGLS